MSKKIAKRGLALGALMAFVITGSAMAAEYDRNLNPYETTVTDKEVIINNGYLYLLRNGNEIDTVLDLEKLTINNNTVKNSNGVDIGGNGITTYSSSKIKADEIILNTGTSTGVFIAGDTTSERELYVEFTKSMSITAMGNGIANKNEDGKITINGNSGSLIVTANENAVWTRANGAQIDIDAGSIKIESKNANTAEPSRGYAVYAEKQGSLIDINANNGDLELIGVTGGVRAENGSTVNLNATNSTQITGDVVAVNSEITANFNGTDSFLTGTVTTVETANTSLTFNNGATWNVTGASKVSNLVANEGKIVFANDAAHVDIDAGSGTLKLSMDSATDFNTVASKLGVKDDAKDIQAQVVLAEGVVTGETTADVTYNTVADKDGYYHGQVLGKPNEKTNTTNAGFSDAVSLSLAAWRNSNDDMNKRLGELRDANGEHGVWVRMVRGESEYDSADYQANTYQLGYDQKAGDWTVGAAISYTEGEGGFTNGSAEAENRGFSVYGSKLNGDGSYIDLVAKYARLDNELTTSKGVGSADYDTDGYAVSAEYGKRFAQSNGLWLEPQVQLTYGTVDSASFTTENGAKVNQDSFDSWVGRIGLRAGMDVKGGNVYARASYLYDFDGEASYTFADAANSRTIEDDLGGGWWEVGVGANINLSKATYIYADVEKTFGGEVDTNWQWNLGVRYSF